MHNTSLLSAMYSSKLRCLSVWLFIAVTPFSSTPARADCREDPGPLIYIDVPNSINCTGVDSDGWPSEPIPELPSDHVFPEPPFDGLSVIVHPGAVVSGFVPERGLITISLPHGSSQTVTNNGMISTSVAGAVSIGMFGGNEAVTNNGSIVTSGQGAESIGILGSYASVANNGTISTTGDFAEGVAIEGYGAEVTNGIGGEILVSGEESEGIGIEGSGSIVLNANQISVDGFRAVGVAILGDFGTITNFGGTIETKGDYSPAIGVIGTGLGTERDIINEGAIKTGGNNSPGIAVLGSSHNIENAMLGNISTTGTNSTGIMVEGDLGTIENNGEIVTTGNAANGILMTASGLGRGTVTNNNEITTSLGNGISVLGDYMTITNDGVIEAGIAGLGAGHMGISVSGNGATIINNNTISTFSEEAQGILLTSSDLALFSHIENDGFIITTRDNADGINLSGGKFIVSNLGGGITTQGAWADGIEMTGNNVSVSTVYNHAEILVSHETSSAVRLSTLTGESASLVNFTSGVLTAPIIAVEGGAGNDAVINEGVINGGVLLNEGNDTYTQRVSGIVNGEFEVDGGDDTDTLVAELTAGQTMDGDQFVNFENLDVKGSGTLTIANTLTVGSSEFLSGTVILEDGSVLSGDATMLGATLMGTGTVGGTLMGEDGAIKPGMSTGNLSVNGDLSLSGTDLELEVNSLLDMDTLTVGGDVIIDGGLMNVILGYTPGSDDVFDFFNVAGSLTVGSGFEGIVGFAAAGSGVPLGTEFNVDLGGKLYVGTVSSVVPIPASVWLFGAGLIGLIGIARRKKS